MLFHAVHLLRLQFKIVMHTRHEENVVFFAHLKR